MNERGEPCDHPGCLAHVSHPCEGCGRIRGKVPETAASMVANLRTALNQKRPEDTKERELLKKLVQVTRKRRLVREFGVKPVVEITFSIEPGRMRQQMPHSYAVMCRCNCNAVKTERDLFHNR